MKRYLRASVDKTYRVYLQEDFVYRHNDRYYDYGDNPIFVEVHSLDEAANAVEKYIDRFDIGSSEFTGGRVEDSAGNKIAQIAYNGKILLPGDKYYIDD